MSEQSTEQRTCRFPGCTRPAVESAHGTGRPPEYCADPEHTRASAWRARQARSATASDQPVDERPVDTARQRAGAIRGQVTEMGEHFLTQFQAMLDELATLSDPEAVEAQLESVTNDAAEQVAAARARATRAEQAQHDAEQQRAEADAAAEEATTAEQQRTARVAELEQQLGQTQGQLEEDQRSHADELAQVRQQLTDAEGARTAAENRAHDLERDLAHATDQVQAAEQATVEATRRAEAAEQAVIEHDQAARSATDRADRAETQLGTAQTRLDEVRDELSQARGQLATVTAERDAAHRDVEQARAYGEQRVADLRASYDQQVTQLRSERDTHASEARDERRRADRAEAQLDPATETGNAPPTSSRPRRRRTGGGDT